MKLYSLLILFCLNVASAYCQDNPPFNPYKDSVEEELLNTYERVKMQDSINRGYDYQLELFIKNKGEKSLDDLEKHCLEVLAKDSSNQEANYTLGMIYYYKGVEIINNLDYTNDVSMLNKKQDEITVLFKKSLPYLKKSRTILPEYNLPSK